MKRAKKHDAAQVARIERERNRRRIQDRWQQESDPRGITVLYRPPVVRKR